MNSLPLLAYHHALGGMTDWLAHVVVSSVVHGLIYSFIFRLMHQLTFGQTALLVIVALGVLFMWSRSRDRRGGWP